MGSQLEGRQQSNHVSDGEGCYAEVEGRGRCTVPDETREARFLRWDTEHDAGCGDSAVDDCFFPNLNINMLICISVITP